MAVLAVSTEDGRVLFYSPSLVQSPVEGDRSSSLPTCQAFAQLGGSKAGVGGRIKDFECLSIVAGDGIISHYIMVTCGSDGVISLWLITNAELTDTKSTNESNEASLHRNELEQTRDSDTDPNATKGPNLMTDQIGKLLGSYETGERITCLKAFVMQYVADRPAVNDEEAELDFDAIYPDDTPKSDPGKDVEESGGESSS